MTAVDDFVIQYTKYIYWQSYIWIKTDSKESIFGFKEKNGDLKVNWTKNKKSCKLLSYPGKYIKSVKCHINQIKWNQQNKCSVYMVRE